MSRSSRGTVVVGAERRETLAEAEAEVWLVLVFLVDPERTPVVLKEAGLEVRVEHQRFLTQRRTEIFLGVGVVAALPVVEHPATLVGVQSTAEVEEVDFRDLDRVPPYLEETVVKTAATVRFQVVVEGKTGTAPLVKSVSQCFKDLHTSFINARSL